MYTPEQRHQLEHVFVVELAAYEGWKVSPDSVHSAAETNPRVKHWLKLARKLLDAALASVSSEEKAIRSKTAIASITFPRSKWHNNPNLHKICQLLLDCDRL